MNLENKFVPKIPSKEDIAKMPPLPEDLSKKSDSPAVDLGKELEEMKLQKGQEDQAKIKEIRRDIFGENGNAEKISSMPPPPPLENSVLKERKNKTEQRELESSREVEDVILRNDAFIVHMVAEMEGVKHNKNSNISQEATWEDDVEGLFAFRPSVSASSFTPGEKTNLWSGKSGFLLGGGQIGEVGTNDFGSHGDGIRKRGGEPSSIEKIDEVVGRKDKFSRQAYEQTGIHSMNEMVVNNPEVFGFFQHAEKDADGKMWAHDLKTKEYAEMAREEQSHGRQKMPGSYSELLQKHISEYQEKFKFVRERGIPLYIMTGDREVYSLIAVNEDGSLEVGKKLTPKEVATGRAGLVSEKRKEIGERILAKNLFRKPELQKEAREIIESL